jgi:hypothetical protein
MDQFLKFFAVGLVSFVVGTTVTGTQLRAHVDGPVADVIRSCVENKGAIGIVVEDDSCKTNKTAADWNARGPTGADGVVGNEAADSSPGPSGSIAGADGQVTYDNGGVAGGAATYYDDLNHRLGVGTPPPAEIIDAVGNISVSGTGNEVDFFTLQNEITDLQNRVTALEEQVACLNGTGDVSGLVAAITAANESPDSDIITLINNCSYTLTEAFPVISSTISIEGYGSTIDGANTFSIFRVTPSGDLTITDLNLINGTSGTRGVGGGISNQGTVTLNGASSIHDNIAASGGGGIYNNAGGTVTLNGTSSIYDNTAGTRGGGIINEGGTVTLNGTSSIHDNSAAVGGGIYNNDGGTVTLNGTGTIHDNTAVTRGGGIYNSGSTLHNALAEITVLNNTPDNVQNFPIAMTPLAP